MNVIRGYNLQLHDGRKLFIKDKALAEEIEREMRWIYEHAAAESQRNAIRCIQCLFAIKLGDHYGWPTRQIGRILKSASLECADILDEETDSSFETLYEQLRDEYGIDLRADGMIQINDTYTDPIYQKGDWRPVKDRLPDAPGSYFCTMRSGKVCFARFDGKKFTGDSGKGVIAWTEMPEPYEFWRDEE